MYYIKLNEYYYWCWNEGSKENDGDFIDGYWWGFFKSDKHFRRFARKNSNKDHPFVFPSYRRAVLHYLKMKRKIPLMKKAKIEEVKD